MKPDLAAIKADLDDYLAYECAIHGGTGSGLQVCYSHEKGHSNLLEWLADGGLTALLAYIAEMEASRQWVDGAPPTFGPDDRKWIIFEHLTPFTRATVYGTAVWLGKFYSEEKVKLARRWALLPLPEVPE